MSGGEQRERDTLATQQQLLHLYTLFHLPVIEYALYLPIAVEFSPGPQPPIGDERIDMFWDAQQSMQCDVVIGNYSVRYQRRNAFTAGYTAVYTSETHVALQELGPGTNYIQIVSCIHCFKC